MARQYVLECVIELPDDLHQMSDIIAKTKDPWNNLVAALRESSVTFDVRSDLRAKRQPKKDLPGVVLATSQQEAAE